MEARRDTQTTTSQMKVWSNDGGKWKRKRKKNVFGVELKLNKSNQKENTFLKKSKKSQKEKKISQK